MVDAGFGDVSARTRAAAILSPKMLNSATGVIWFLKFSDMRSGVIGCLMRRYGGGRGL